MVYFHSIDSTTVSLRIPCQTSSYGSSQDKGKSYNDMLLPIYECMFQSSTFKLLVLYGNEHKILIAKSGTNKRLQTVSKCNIYAVLPSPKAHRLVLKSCLDIAVDDKEPVLSRKSRVVKSMQSQ